jgi:hypothetical protein
MPHFKVWTSSLLIISHKGIGAQHTETPKCLSFSAVDAARRVANDLQRYIEDQLEFSEGMTYQICPSMGIPPVAKMVEFYMHGRAVKKIFIFEKIEVVEVG